MAPDSSRRLTEELLGGLAAALGEPLTLDASGQCVLLFEQDVEIVLAVTDDRLTLRSTLVPWSAAMAADALVLNYGELPVGIAVALDRSSNLLVLLCSLEATALSADGFVARVAELVGLVPLVRARLAGDDAAPVHAVLPVGIRG